jgi:hypothetical protein
MQIVELLDRLRDAVAPDHPRTDSIRTIALQLESMAKTPDEKDAIRCLKKAIPDGDLPVIAARVQKVFRQGIIGVDGWPLK